MKIGIQMKSLSAVCIHNITYLKIGEIKFEDSLIKITKYEDEMQIEASLGNL